MKKLYFLLFVILTSGCITTQINKNTGVVIESFVTDMQEVYSGEPVSFRVKVKNTGSVDAKNVFAELYGLDESWCESTKTCDPRTHELFPTEKECRYDTDGFVLNAPNPLTGSQGDSHVCTWNYVAPEIDPDFSIHYTPKVGIYYTYKTITTASITLLPQKELIRIKDSGASLPSETLSSTNSPVKINIQTHSPIRYWKDTDTIVTPIKITITNTGNGFPCYGETENPPHRSCKATKCKNCKNKVKLRIISFDNDITIGGDCIKITEKPIYLPFGKSNSFVCYIQITNPPKYTPVQKEVRAEAVYEYYTEKQISLTLKGSRTRLS